MSGFEVTPATAAKITWTLDDVTLDKSGWRDDDEVVQIDPSGCGCTECMVGEYRPLNKASEYLLFKLMTGQISNATGISDEDLRFSIEVSADGAIHGIKHVKPSGWADDTDW